MNIIFIIRAHLGNSMYYFRRQLNWLRLRIKLSMASTKQKQYFRTQLERSMLKRIAGPAERVHYLLSHVKDIGILNTQSRVLCVGCRDTQELDIFTQYGCADISGIDLYSRDSRIKVMDMHQLEFPEACFDIVYSCHSLEHAHDPDRALSEFIRVLRPGGHLILEVPNRFTPTGSDLHDLGPARVLLKRIQALGPVSQVLLVEDGLNPATIATDNPQYASRVICQMGKRL